MLWNGETYLRIDIKNMEDKTPAILYDWNRG